VNILNVLGPVAGIHTKIAVVLYRQPDQTEDRLVCFFLESFCLVCCCERAPVANTNMTKPRERIVISVWNVTKTRMMSSLIDLALALPNRRSRLSRDGVRQTPLT
jgi:hypothetical protein